MLPHTFTLLKKTHQSLLCWELHAPISQPVHFISLSASSIPGSMPLLPPGDLSALKVITSDCSEAGWNYPSTSLIHCVMFWQGRLEYRHGNACVCRETLCSNESCNLWFNCSHSGHSQLGLESYWCLNARQERQQRLWLMQLSVLRTLPLIQLRHLQPLIGHWTCPSQSGLINGCDKWFRNSVMSYLQVTSILICQIIQLRHRKLTVTDTSVNESDCVRAGKSKSK